MQLTINGQIHSENPDADQLKSAVANLGGEEFLILSRGSDDDELYIQTYHNKDDSWQLEYRDGSADRHFYLDPQSITIDDVTDALVMYLNDPASIEEKWTWKKLDL